MVHSKSVRSFGLSMVLVACTAVLCLAAVGLEPTHSAHSAAQAKSAIASSRMRARLSPGTQEALEGSFRRERNGWIYVHLEGTPDRIGYQHGYLLAPEIKEALRVFEEYLPHTTKHDWSFYRKAAHSLFWDKIGDEYRQEIKGIAKGASERGVLGSRQVEADDILALNAWIELAQYYVPSIEALAGPDVHRVPPPSCSAFIATGRYTRDGNVVIGHNNWIDYLIGRHWNIVMDLKPASGHRILMDSFPGFIHSGDDFYITDAGLMVTETTITQFKGFKQDGLPEF
ncbi:MAG TPA: C45 family autoproteolytic acyltransferase/hydrolase, partial [Blastocatellia bacterium]|nr:C45 family autoproteolytic acyltransferase/hydrolase [Blastocatellia bacterium]